MTPIFSLNIKGRLVEYHRPAVMGIINATPDSFHSASRAADAADAARRALDILSRGADMIDLGACSTRPGASDPGIDEELNRLLPALDELRSAAPEAIISVDTYRAEVARKAVEHGADIINDISGGNLDPEMFDVVASLRVPYILTHMRGTPADMMKYATYEDVTAEVMSELGDRLSQLAMLGVADVIIDPGFGFSKTPEQNFELLRNLHVFKMLHRPILVGVSRKSMLTSTLGIAAADALEATVATGAFALDRGAAILRVHDVTPAVQSAVIFEKLHS